MDGTSINDIARILKREKVLLPSAYAFRKGYQSRPRASREVNTLGTRPWCGRYCKTSLMLAAFLRCSDCGANLKYKYTHDNPDNHYPPAFGNPALRFFEDEQSALKQNMKHLRSVAEEEKAHEMNPGGFLELVRKYANADKLILTPDILHAFIDKVVVHHREQVGKDIVQRVEIYYRMIGAGANPSYEHGSTGNVLAIIWENEKDRITIS